MTALEAPLSGPAWPEGPRAPMLLAVLTDEELVALGAAHPIVGLPHYERLSATAQQVAVSTARRLLLARGDQPEQPETIPLHQQVSDLLDVRVGASRVLVLRRSVTILAAGTRQQVETERYAHMIDEFVLLEDVSAHGLHRFWACGTDLLADTVADFVGHPQLRNGAGPPVTLDPTGGGPDGTGLPQLGELPVTVDVTVWRRGPQPPPTMLSLLLGRDGCWATHHGYGVRGPAVLNPVAMAEVGGLVTALVEAVRIGP